jgi:hypothetical protein
MPGTQQMSGFRRPAGGGSLQLYVNGVLAATFDDAAPYLTLVSGLTVSADGLTITAGGLTVTAGGVVVTASGITVTDGGVAIRGGARLRESMTAASVVTAGAGTYTAAQLVGGIIVRDPAGAARVDTTDTGTAIETELNAQGITVATGDTFLCYVINVADAAEAITIAGGTGVTGNAQNLLQTIAQNESAILLFIRTGANAYDIHVIGA